MAPTRRPTPNAPADSFAGAEGSAREQGKQAVSIVAQYGRAGMQALINQRAAASGQAGAVQRDLSSLTKDFNAPAALKQQLQGQARTALAPYARDAAVAARGYSEDLEATTQATRTYYDQVAQGVPMLRSAAQQTVAGYKTAWEENESRRVAEETERALQAQRQQEQIAFAQRQHNEQMALSRASQAQQVAMENARMGQAAQQNAAQLALQRRELDLAYPGPGGAGASRSSAGASRSSGRSWARPRAWGRR